MAYAQAGGTVYSPADEERLFATLWSDDLKYDPLAFAAIAFPWGQPNTILASESGPRTWQKDTMVAIRDHFKANRVALECGLTDAATVFKDAVSSGRGIGKSAELGMVTCWFASCWPGSTTIVTANTQAQLTSKTMPEIRKWFALAINSHWWELESLKISPKRWYAEALKALKIDAGYYFVQATVWSADNPDAFAGTHNMYGMLVVFDEASGIPRGIWTVTEGFFTERTVNRIWLARSNPRNVVNGFYDCFKANSGWRTRHIDGRQVENTDKGVYDSIIARYGLNSDEVRIEVKGQFPKQGDNSLFDLEAVQTARTRKGSPADYQFPLVMAIDVARFGPDKSIFSWRRGLDCNPVPWLEFSKIGIAELAANAAEQIEIHRPQHVTVDANGVGGGVIDVLLRDYRIKCVPFYGNGGSLEPQKHVNLRADSYIRLSQFMFSLALPDNAELQEDLLAIKYKYNPDNLKKILDKDEIKKDLGRSPDWADALMMLFSKKWPPLAVQRKERSDRDANYDPLTYGLS